MILLPGVRCCRNQKTHLESRALKRDAIAARDKIRTYVFRSGCTWVAVVDEGVELAVASLDAVGWVVTTVVEKCFELGMRARGTTVGDMGAASRWEVVVVVVVALFARKREEEWLEK